MNFYLSAADKAEGPFQLEGEERKLVFESECEFPFTIMSLPSRVELAHCKCSINTRACTHTFMRNSEDRGEDNKANCIRSQETWIPVLAVIQLNYVAMGNFFLVENQQCSTKLFLMYFLF